jgi:DNA-binding GntR family transcriptional regulator
MSKVKNPRASDEAYRIIKKAIIEGKLHSGEKLGKRAMAELCGTSIIPVIDALNWLEAEGLVESNPYTGSRVVGIDSEKIADLFVLREAIEVQIVRILCYTIGVSDAEPLLELARDIDKMAGLEEKDGRYDEMHYNFHHSLARLTGSKLLLGEIERLEFFSLLVNSEVSYTAREKTDELKAASHEDIITAILKRNPVEAQDIMRFHIYRSGTVKMPYWVQNTVN